MNKNQTRMDYKETGPPLFDEFKESLWEYVSEKVVSNKYLDDYPDFIDNLSFDLYALHLKGEIDLNIVGKFVEIFFHNLFHYSSSCEDNGYGQGRNIDLGAY